jgi:hypothetical protein
MKKLFKNPLNALNFDPQFAISRRMNLEGENSQEFSEEISSISELF